VLKEHVVDVPFRPVGDDAAEGAAGFFAGLLEFKEIDVLVYCHA
jgi:hypothetical protein